MKQLTELKDGQKVLVALKVQIDKNNDELPIDLYSRENRIVSLNENLIYLGIYPEEIYDFDELMNAKKSEPISKEEFEKKVENIFGKEMLLGASRLKKPLYDLFQFYHPIEEQKSEPIIKPEFDAIIEDYLHQLHTDCIGENQFLQKMYNLFQSYHPESFTPEVGKEYEFSFDGVNWTKGVFKNNYYTYILGGIYEHTSKYIRTIQQSDEELKAIELLKSLGYKIEK